MDKVTKSKRKPPVKGGSRKGIPNKTTQDARQAIAAFVDGNAHRLTGWLDAVANGDPVNDVKPNPVKAFELFQSVVEYHVPKLARTELTGKDGEAFKVSVIERKIVKASN
ncbi:hypothetical protein UFOVP607_45 [uncultured Caudovirales phage]|uniref:Uncharacterized protein n=1 Tax=uncultured Caudovirales phage TaxID=2100421 RepID=A0A6J5N2V8_9CAUD|nr:hypothetical protein UFOVP607_45 [uncultured Caudovirales phage]